MIHPSLNPDDLEDSVSAVERVLLAEVADRLIRARPAPRAGFRAEMRARMRVLGASDQEGSRPAWLWRRVALLAASGSGLLGLVGLGLGHIGPFAP